MTALIRQPSTIARYYANIIDFIILSTPRFLILIGFALFGEKQRQMLLNEVEIKFGSLDRFDFGDKEAVNMLFNSDYIRTMLAGVSVCIALGFAYHVIMTNSSWVGTFGQRLAKIIVVKKDGDKMTFGDALTRVSLSYIVWIFPLLVLINWNSSRVSSILFIVVISMWGDLSFLIKKKESVPDFISGTLLSVGRVEKKLSLFSAS